MFGIGGFNPLKMLSSFIPQLQAINMGLQMLQMGAKLFQGAIDMFERAANQGSKTNPSERGTLPLPEGLSLDKLESTIVNALSKAIEKTLGNLTQQLEKATGQQAGGAGENFDIGRFIERLINNQTEQGEGGGGGEGKPAKGGKGGGGKSGATSSNPWVAAYAKIMQFIDDQMQKLNDIDFETMTPSEAGTKLFEVQVGVQQAQKGADAISNAFKSWTDAAGTAVRNYA